MNYSYSKKELSALYVPEEERPYQPYADRLTDSIARAVLSEAKQGKTYIKGFQILTASDILLKMIMRQLNRKFPDSVIGYETKEGSEVKLFSIDWS
jgi:hypothetical protein